MEDIESKPASSGRFQNTYLKASITLRSLALVASLAAAVVMALDKQTVEVVVGIQFTADYKTSPTFVFFVIGNAILCVYSLVSISFYYALIKGVLLHLLDLGMMVLSMATVASTTAIAYVGKNGNKKTGWSEMCSMVGKFCNNFEISLACGYVAFLLLLAICILSTVHRAQQINAC